MPNVHIRLNIYYGLDDRVRQKCDTMENGWIENGLRERAITCDKLWTHVTVSFRFLSRYLSPTAPVARDLYTDQLFITSYIYIVQSCCQCASGKLWWMLDASSPFNKLQCWFHHARCSPLNLNQTFVHVTSWIVAGSQCILDFGQTVFRIPWCTLLWGSKKHFSLPGTGTDAFLNADM